MNRRMFFGTVAAALVGTKLASEVPTSQLPPGGAIPGTFAEDFFAKGAIVRYTAGAMFDTPPVDEWRFEEWQDDENGEPQLAQSHHIGFGYEPGALTRAIERLKARA